MIQTKYTDATNYQGLYEALRELAPTLADVSSSLIPNEIPYNFQPALTNAIIMNRKTSITAILPSITAILQ